MTSKLRLLIFAGPNGSGKSTFTTPEILTGFDIAPDQYINADDIACRRSQEMPNEGQTEREWAAFYEARHQRQIYREQKISFAFETVFSHPSTFLDIEACRQAGFEIIVVFITTKDWAINVERVARRFQSGGHNVAGDKIISRYGRSMSFLPRIIEESDYAFIYDNSDIKATKFTFKQGFPSVINSPPPFIQQQLLKPWLARRRERLTIQRNFANVQLPSLQSSQFYGNVVWVGNHYIIQSTVDCLMLHDLCLFSTSEQQRLSNESIQVSYENAAGSLIIS
jgi:predicted ABC-type ATPase